MKANMNKEAIKILIVEDNEDDLFFIKKALSFQNFEISVIESGIDAYNYLLSAKNKPDIVLLDNKLPGMNGIEILQKICKSTNEYSFIFLTVDNSIATVLEAMKAGALDFIVKSSDLKIELPEKIEKVFEIHKTKLEKLKIGQELITAKLRAEESEEKYRAMYNNAPLAYQSLNENGCLIDVNPMWLKTLEYEKDEVIGTWFGSHLHPDYVEHFKINFPAFKKRGCISDVQFKMRKKNGNEIYVSFEGCVGYTPDGKFKQTYCVFKDITEQKKAEKEIIQAKELAEENEGKYKNALIDLNKAQSVAKVGSWKWYVQENRLEWSKEMYRIFGIDESSFSGRLDEIINKTIHPEDKKAVENSNNLVAENATPIPLEYRVILPDGSVKTVWAEAGEIVRDKSSQPYILSGIVQDITHRKEAELELQWNEERHREMISNISDVIGIIGQDGIMKYKSPNITKWFGWQPQDLVGTDGWLTVHPDDLQRLQVEFYKLLEKEKSSTTVVYKYKCKDGSYKPIELTATNLVNDPVINGVLLNYHDITERKKVELELLTKTKTLQSVFESAPYIMLLVNPEGRVTDINRVGISFTGKRKEELIGLPGGEVFSCINAQDGKICGQGKLCEHCPIRNRVSQTFQSGESIFEGNGKLTVIKNGNHSILDILISTTLVQMDDNKLVLVTIADITDKKRMEYSLQKSEANLAKAQQIAKIGSWEWDMVSNTISWSKEMYKVFDIVADNKIIKPELLLEVIHPDDIELYLKSVGDNLSEGSSSILEYRIIHKDGSVHHILGQGQVEFDENTGKPIRSVGTAQDITERKKSEEALQQSELNYRRFMDESNLGIRILNTAGITVYVNKALLDIYGLESFQEFKETPVSKRYTARELINHEKRKIERKKDRNTSSDYEIEIKHKDGEIRSLQVLRKEIIWDKTLHYQIIYQNITDKKRAEAELIIAKEKAEESDRLKTAFLQNMSHEIRTPMNAINGFSGMLNKPGISEAKRNSFISIIKSSSSQLLSIVTDILTISAIDTHQEKLNIEAVSINNIIVDLQSIFKTQTQNQNVSLFSKQQLTDKESEIYTDKTKITQILTNLIANALKFTHEGFVEFGYELVKTRGRASLQFYVKDSGIGIKAELHEKIFERFRQAELSISRKYGGTGLGLSISKGYIELMGGKIWLESDLGKGSTFYFTIPYKPVCDKKTDIDTVLSTSQSTVLVAEDEEYNYLFIEELLNELGLNIIHAKNGKETVEICKSNPTIGLVLMDIKMPLLDGHTAALKIKEFRPQLPIIAQTAYALEIERERYQGAFDDYITKPINEDELRKKLKKYIEIKV